MRIDYTADGDSIPSQFEKDFKLGYYDRDLVEKDWITVPESSIGELLVDFSYDNQLIPQIHSVDKEYNTIILIYNYNYEQEPSGIKHLNGVDFIEVVKYVEE